MTEQVEIAIEEAPEVDAVNDGEETQEPQEAVEEVTEESLETESSEEVEFPKKAVNALNRKDKKINKLSGRIRELEAKLNESHETKPHESVNPDDFENYGDYISAQIKASVEQQTQQSQTDMQKQQLTQQQEALKAERDQYIIEQAQEASQTFSDLPQVWQQNATVLDSLPKDIEDIFYSIDNAPAAVYMLAKEGKLESLLHANPAIAAYEIVNAQNKGMELLSKTNKRVSAAPTPISKAKGTGSTKKQLSAEDDVLKSLGLK